MADSSDSSRNDSMVKGYVISSGGFFVALALMHLTQAIVESQSKRADPWAIFRDAGIGGFAALLCFWAWRLYWKTVDRKTKGFRRSGNRRSVKKPSGRVLSRPGASAEVE